jgi:hypothetical protein
MLAGLHSLAAPGQSIQWGDSVLVSKKRPLAFSHFLQAASILQLSDGMNEFEERRENTIVLSARLVSQRR